jgi:hypothetical protein
MAVFIAALLFLIGIPHVQAQTGWDYLSDTPERVIGLLDVPDIVQGGCGPAPARAAVRVFGAPSQSGHVVGTIYWHEEADRGCGLVIETPTREKEQLPTLESGYEIPAAIVFERRGEWFRIRLAKGSAWIHHNDATDFLSYPEMLRDSLPHTLQTWDGTLRAAPGPSGRLTPLPSGWKELLDRQLSVQYLGSRRVGADLWLHIRLAAKAACDHSYGDMADVEGWIPAYHTDLSPLVWFSSRGC